jgi:hypothetical protein
VSLIAFIVLRYKMFVIKFKGKLNRIGFILVEMNFKWCTYVDLERHGL